MARVVVAQGELLGKVEKLPSGNTFASFKGIPYAAPPLGKLRFKAPIPPENWSGLRDATKHGGVCPHVEITTGVVIDGDEDCLFLNVYTPDLRGPLPVMVWLHGGGFYSGSGNSEIHGPDHFMVENVILVTINYRLEALGFLCLDTPEFPGNAGMKDQVAALKWVKQNIAQFGGDSNNITLFGESSGAVSATYHMVSPMSKGLFNKVIAQSGCFFNEWAICRKSKQRAFTLAKALGKETQDENELIEFLQSLPARKLTNVTSITVSQEEKMRDFPVIFGPTVEKIFEGQECFLPKLGNHLLEEGHCINIPTLVGYTSAEGLLNVQFTLKNAKAINAHFEKRVHNHILERVTEEQLKEITTRLKDFYFGDREMSTETIPEIVTLETDYDIFVGMMEFAQKLSRRLTHPVYFYRFSAVSHLNIVKQLFGMTEYEGACHADDIFYLFKTFVKIEKGSKEWKTVKKMVRMWTNFAKYGNPTPRRDELIQITWEPVTKTKINFLDICIDKLNPGQDPDRERFEFWRSIVDSVYHDKNVYSNI